MEFLKKINSKAKAEKDSGFGTNASSYGGRFLNKNGKANIKKSGIGFMDSISWFHTLLNIPRWKFMVIVVFFYFFSNLLFATIYYTIGVEHLNGMTGITNWEKFGQAFFFSIQTFTTVGYGHISPSGFLTSLVAAIEALFGLLSFAIATGLFYGRFSKPQAHLKFSYNAVIAPYLEGTALMIRLSPFKNTNFTDAEAKMTLGLVLDEKGKYVNKFYSLDLELSKVNALSLSWTLVHPITENSPLYNFSKEQYENINGEVLVYVKVYDDMYSTHVVKRASYTLNEIIYGAKFLPMFSRSEDDNKTILHLDKLNLFEKVTL